MAGGERTGRRVEGVGDESDVEGRSLEAPG